MSHGASQYAHFPTVFTPPPLGAMPCLESKTKFFPLKCPPPPYSSRYLWTPPLKWCTVGPPEGRRERTYALAFSHRTPPVQNMRICEHDVSLEAFLSTQVGNSWKVFVLGLRELAKVPIATSLELRQSMRRVEGEVEEEWAATAEWNSDGVR